MTFPLITRTLIRGVKYHIKDGLKAACDYVASNNIVYARCDGVLSMFKEVKGGNWLRVTRADGYRFEFAHLSEYIRKSG